MTAMRKSLCFVVTAEQTALTFYRGYVRYLADAGYDVWVISSSSGKLGALEVEAGIRTVSVPMERNPSPVRDLISFVRLAWEIRKIRPTAVVFATPKASLLAGVASLVLRVPTRVYQLWGLRLETVNGPALRILKFAERITAFSSTVIVANSQSLANSAVAYGVTAGKTPVVLGRGSSHGVDLARFSQEAGHRLLDGGTSRFIEQRGLPVVGFVGRLHPDKGLRILIQALMICRRKGVRFATLIVGPLDSDASASLDLDATDVHVVGEVDDTAPYIGALDVLCLPTFREGFPNVVLEAGAMGIPSVVSRATGAIDSVVEGRTGLTFQTGDAHDLAEKLTQVMSDSSLRAALGQNAQAWVKEHFSADSVWQMQEQFLREQLDHGRRNIGDARASRPGVRHDS